MSDTIDRQAAIDTEGLDEQIRCEMCRNPMHTDRGCDGNCKYDEKLYERIMQILGERIKPLPSAQPEVSKDINVPINDCVSRQAMFDTAAEYEKQLREILGDENELVEVVKILKHRLIALPSVQPERKTDDWTPCGVTNQCFIPSLKDMTYRGILVTYETRTGKRLVREMWVDHGRIVGKSTNGTPIAWKPLPEPYRGEVDA